MANKNIWTEMALSADSNWSEREQQREQRRHNLRLAQQKKGKKMDEGECEKCGKPWDECDCEPDEDEDLAASLGLRTLALAKEESDDDVAWITIHGVHIPIKQGKDAPPKSEQIAHAFSKRSDAESRKAHKKTDISHHNRAADLQASAQSAHITAGLDARERGDEKKAEHHFALADKHGEKRNTHMKASRILSGAPLAASLDLVKSLELAKEESDDDDETEAEKRKRLKEEGLTDEEIDDAIAEDKEEEGEEDDAGDVEDEEDDLEASLGLRSGTLPLELGGKKEGKCEHLNADGTFVGGFDGCVTHMMDDCGGGHSEESAKRICGAINRDKNLSLNDVLELAGNPYHDGQGRFSSGEDSNAAGKAEEKYHLAAKDASAKSDKARQSNQPDHHKEAADAHRDAAKQAGRLGMFGTSVQKLHEDAAAQHDAKSVKKSPLVEDAEARAEKAKR